MSEQVLNSIIQRLRAHWQRIYSTPFPNCRVEDTNDASAPYCAQLYYNADERVLSFRYDATGALVSSGITITADTHSQLIPVYPYGTDIPNWVLLTFTNSNNIRYAQGMIGLNRVHYYHCPACSGFISGAPTNQFVAREGLRATAYYCRRCGVELAISMPIDLRKSQ